MVTDTKQFDAGLKRATAGLTAFGSIANKIATGNPFKTMAVGMYSIGKGTQQAFNTSAELGAIVPLMAHGVAGLTKDFDKSFSSLGQGLGRVALGFTMVGGGIAKIGYGIAAKGLGLIGSAALSLGHTLAEAAKLALVFGLAAAALTKFAHVAIDSATQTTRAKLTFGQYSKTVISDAEQMSQAYGISKKSFIESASGLGMIAKAAGYTQQQAAAIGSQFAKLGANLASELGMPLEEVMSKLEGGLAGHARGLHQLGILMTDDAIKSYAMAKGIGVLGQELTESEKTTARVGYLSQELAKHQGVLAAKAGSTGQEIGSLSGRFESLAESIGSALLPIIGPIFGELNVAIKAVSMAWEESGFAAIATSTDVQNSAGAQAKSIGWLQKSIGFVADAWQNMKMPVFYVESYISAGIGHMIEGLAYLSSGLDSMAEKLHLSKTGATEALNSYAEAFKKSGVDLMAKFNEEAAKPPASNAVDAYFAKAREQIAKARTDVKGLGTDISQFRPTPSVKQPGELKFAKAAAYGSSEATNTLLRSRYGGGQSGKDAAKTAAATTESAKHLAKLVDLAGKSSTPGLELWSNFK
ncbi:MAG: hypothetical protein ACHRXM_24145 [Isosphaerales bacterium]